MRATGQFTLPINRGPRLGEAEFRQAPSNAEAVTWLRRTEQWPEGRLALWGEAGRGKTHLLHIWAARTGADLRRGSELVALAEIPTTGVALDDADGVGDERTLLHLLNAAREAGCPVLLASRLPPARWGSRLADLSSRLRATVAVELAAPEDELLRSLLARLLADRQLRPAEPVQGWLVQHLPRSAAALRAAVERLDAAALEEHRNITVPFASRVLADLLEPDEISGTDIMPTRQDEPTL